MTRNRRLPTILPLPSKEHGIKLRQDRTKMVESQRQEKSSSIAGSGSWSRRSRSRLHSNDRFPQLLRPFPCLGKAIDCVFDTLVQRHIASPKQRYFLDTGEDVRVARCWRLPPLTEIFR